MSYEWIVLPPYNGDAESPLAALLNELDMNVYFDDADAETCLFCFKEDADSPIVDYEVDWTMLEHWFMGMATLMLRANEHDPSRFPEDLTFYEEG